MTRVPFSVAIIGCGLIGRRRAGVAAEHSMSRVSYVVDVNADVAAKLAEQIGCDRGTDWREVMVRDDVNAVVVATPNAFLAEIATAALRAGKHVLLEKPMGRNLAEAKSLAGVARDSGRVLKVGFNHRYHPAIAQAQRLAQDGAIGRLINIRACYGHGGRPGYEQEWRCNPELAGGGELTDQGVHIVDLLHWFAGAPAEAFAFLQTAVWPIAPLEDNAFGLFRFPGGVVANLHTSWTQWKNRFSFDVFGEDGSLSIEGLGGSYGQERLTLARRNPLGGKPEVSETSFDGPDCSWQLEWDDFVNAIAGGATWLGTPGDGLMAMRMLDALYRSASRGEVVTL